MTGSEDHRGSRGIVDLCEVSHARIAIIADLRVVLRTGATQTRLAFIHARADQHAQAS
jgi:hypothetical protein